MLDFLHKKMDISELYMLRCLELAAHGRGQVAPNPMVGAVLVAEGKIIGEGFHRCYGEAHAEANAIASVKDEAFVPRSTLYVNLEPCSHYGKTPPCAELIIRKAIPRVVVACLDPNPKVAGSGIQMLRDAGVEVVVGVMEREATALNRFFMTAHRRHRPYVILKWAQSEDGFIDRQRTGGSEKPFKFSTFLTRMMVHRLRSEVQAIMVGVNTALMDNPSLTVRHWPGKSPVRVLVDRHLQVPEGSALYDGVQQTLVFTQQHTKEDEKKQIQGKENVKYIKMNDSGYALNEVMSILCKNNLHSLLVEGGACLQQSFLDENVWDELIIEKAPVRLDNGICAASLPASSDVHLVDRQYVYSSGLADERPSVVERFINDSI